MSGLSGRNPRREQRTALVGVLSTQCPQFTRNDRIEHEFTREKMPRSCVGRPLRRSQEFRNPGLGSRRPNREVLVEYLQARVGGPVCRTSGRFTAAKFAQRIGWPAYAAVKLCMAASGGQNPTRQMWESAHYVCEIARRQNRDPAKLGSGVAVQSTGSF